MNQPNTVVISFGGADLTGTGNPERLEGAYVTPGFFETLGTPAALEELVQVGLSRRGLFRRDGYPLEVRLDAAAGQVVQGQRVQIGDEDDGVGAGARVEVRRATETTGGINVAAAVHGDETDVVGERRVPEAVILTGSLHGP